MEIPDINIEDLLRNSKIRVRPEQSEEIQAMVYSIGGGWTLPPDFQIRNLQVPFLFIDSAFLLHPGGLMKQNLFFPRTGKLLTKKCRL